MVSEAAYLGVAEGGGPVLLPVRVVHLDAFVNEGFQGLRLLGPLLGRTGTGAGRVSFLVLAFQKL